MAEDVFRLHCKPSWPLPVGKRHDPSVYYVIRDGVARQLSADEMQQHAGRKQFDFPYPECDSPECPNLGKFMSKPRYHWCARLDGTSVQKVQVLTFRCFDVANHVLHTAHVLTPGGYKVDRIGTGKYRGQDETGQTFGTLPLTALDPKTGEPIDPDARAINTLAHQRPWKDPVRGPILLKAVIDATKRPARNAKASATRKNLWKNRDYREATLKAMREGMNTPQEQKRRSEEMKERHAKQKEKLAKAWRPDNWGNPPCGPSMAELWRSIGAVLLSQKYMSNQDLGERLDAAGLRCLYGQKDYLWEDALSSDKNRKQKGAINLVTDIRNWVKRPGKNPARKSGQSPN